MFKAKKALMFIIPVFVLHFCFLPVFAADNVYYVDWSRPAVGGGCGYVDILRTGANGNNILTYVWVLEGSHSYSNTDSGRDWIVTGSVQVTVGNQKISFQAMGGAKVHIFYYRTVGGGVGYLGTTTGTLNDEFNGGVLSCNFYGDLYGFSKTFNDQNIPFTVIYNDNASDHTLRAILNEIQSSGEKEKTEAQTGSQSAQSDAQNALPDNSGSLLNGVGGFISGMSYNGTDCKWTFPAVSLPAISGIMDSVQLTGQKDISFSDFLNVIPDNILTIMRAICSVAVIVFGFKEFYSTIEYVLTLRGGGDTV